jgi:hypothetical protein
MAPDGPTFSGVADLPSAMSEDDEPAYGSTDVKDEDGQYGGTEDGGDEKRSAGGETDEREENDEEDGDEERSGRTRPTPSNHASSRGARAYGGP